MRRLLSMLLALCLLPLAALADGRVIDLTADPDAAWQFEEGAPVLEMVYPPLQGADACILRMDGQVMMIDCATDDQCQLSVVPTLQKLGITHVDAALNSHPHDDHLTGFEYLEGTATIGKLLVAFPEDANFVIKRTMRVMAKQGVPVEHVQDGDVLTLGDTDRHSAPTAGSDGKRSFGMRAAAIWRVHVSVPGRRGKPRAEHAGGKSTGMRAEGGHTEISAPWA